MAIRCKKYKSWCEDNLDGNDNPWTIANLNFGTIAYDKASISSVFDRYYSCFYIVNPCGEDFADELQLAYDMAKENIDMYYAMLVDQSASEFKSVKVVEDDMAKRHTDMDVEYAQRNVTEEGYDYPISGVPQTSTPNTALKTVENSKTDKTDVDHDAYKDTHTTTEVKDPKSYVEFIKSLTDFNAYFISQFKDCFTLISGSTW